MSIRKRFFLDRLRWRRERDTVSRAPAVAEQHERHAGRRGHPAARKRVSPGRTRDPMRAAFSGILTRRDAGRLMP